MKKNVAFVTGSRADYGLLKNLINQFNNDKKNYIFKVLATGMHLQKRYGETIHNIIQDYPKNTKIIRMNINGDNSHAINEYISSGIKKFSIYFKKNKFDFIVVLGDRTEIFAATVASYYQRIPIIHLHGGEVTKGSLDDSIRHSISKMSSIHFVAHSSYKKRLIQLGEEKNKIFNVGAIGVDSIFLNKKFTKKNILKKYSISLKSKNLLVTFHPDTISSKDNIRQIKILLKTFSKFKDIFYLFTIPNNDINNLTIIKSIKKFEKNNQNSKLVPSLGQTDYFSILKLFDGVIGNSSSGIIEVPYFNKGVINIGHRQDGRIFSKKIISCNITEDEITKSIKKLYSKKFKTLLNLKENIYGRQGVAKRIFKVLKNIKFNENKIKSFKDINFKC